MARRRGVSLIFILFGLLPIPVHLCPDFGRDLASLTSGLREILLCSSIAKGLHAAGSRNRPARTVQNRMVTIRLMHQSDKQSC